MRVAPVPTGAARIVAFVAADQFGVGSVGVGSVEATDRGAQGDGESAAHREQRREPLLDRDAAHVRERHDASTPASMP